MSTLSITYKSPSRMNHPESVVPADIPVEQLIQLFVEETNLPRIGPGGGVIDYEFWWEEKERTLDAAATLLDQGIPTGATLWLRDREGKVDPSSRIPFQPGPSDTSVTVDITLTTLSNERVTETFPLDAKTIDVLLILNKKYHFESNGLVLKTEYAIQCNSVTLLPNRTLRDSRINNHDRLDVVRIDKVGGGV